MIEVSVYYPVAREVGKLGKGKVRVEFVIPRRPFLVWKAFEEGVETRFPRGYGRAYFNWETGRELLAPMPFNVVIGLMIWLYKWTKYGMANWFWNYRAKARGEK